MSTIDPAQASFPSEPIIGRPSGPRKPPPSLWAINFQLSLLDHLLSRERGAAAIAGGRELPRYRVVRSAILRTRIGSLIGCSAMKHARIFSGATHVCQTLGSRGILHQPSEMARHLAQSGVQPASGEECFSAAAGVTAGYHLALWDALVDVLNGTNNEPLSTHVGHSDQLTDDYRDALCASLYPHEEALRKSCAGAYEEISEGTRASYRDAADALAADGGLSAGAVLREAGRLALQTRDLDIGHFLVGDGQEALRASLKLPSTQARPSVVSPLKLLTVLALSSFATAMMAVLILAPGRLNAGLSVLLGIVAASLIFDCANQLYRQFRSTSDDARILPSLRADHPAVRLAATTVAFPVLISANGLSSGLLERIAAMAFGLDDTNVRFAILADFGDAMDGPLSADENRAFDHSVALIADFNKEIAAWGAKPIALLYRDRTFSVRDQIWWGRGRKAGKIHGFVSLAASLPSELRVIAGEADAVLGATYLLILDEDCWIDRAGVLGMVAEALHPLNRPKIGVTPSRVVGGAGAFAPFTSRPPESVERPFANLLQGPLIGAASLSALRDSNFDLWGERQFSGKGLIDVTAAAAVLPGSVDIEQVLSHDYIEGSFLHGAFTEEAVVRDLEPASYPALLSRRERWLRGDFQNLFLLLHPRGAFARLTPFGIFLVLENCRRALFPVFFAIGLVFAISGALRWEWSVALIALPLLTDYLLFAWPVSCDVRTGSIVGRMRGRAAQFRSIHQQWLAFIASSPHLALLALICLARSTVRVARRRRLLEWRVFSEVNRQGGGTGVWPTLVALPSGFAALYLLYCAVEGPITAFQLLICSLWIFAPVFILDGELAGGFINRRGEPPMNRSGASA